MAERFDEAAHRVIEEHRRLKVQQLDQILADCCRCEPRHTAEMVIRSIEVCDYAKYQTECLVIDGVLWALDDIHATLFPDHSLERLN